MEQEKEPGVEKEQESEPKLEPEPKPELELKWDKKSEPTNHLTVSTKLMVRKLTAGVFFI